MAKDKRKALLVVDDLGSHGYKAVLKQCGVKDIIRATPARAEEMLTSGSPHFDMLVVTHKVGDEKGRGLKVAKSTTIPTLLIGGIDPDVPSHVTHLGLPNAKEFMDAVRTALASINTAQSNAPAGPASTTGPER